MNAQLPSFSAEKGISDHHTLTSAFGDLLTKLFGLGPMRRTVKKDLRSLKTKCCNVLFQHKKDTRKKFFLL